jgi:hypothetical protein
LISQSRGLGDVYKRQNYAFVVQTFDATNKLTGYQAMIKAL